MLNTLFPYQLYLHIFQLDEYSVGKFLNWIGAHFLTRHSENKKPLVWTQKAKIIYYLAILLALLSVCVLTFYFNLVGFILGMLLVTQAYLFLIIASYLLLPIEKYKKNSIKNETKTKLAAFPKLKIIGITGSYGKTSVKEFLYQILSSEHRVLKTPESYNTPYGIAKVVDLELDDSYEYFICEMGAYRIGEIKEICEMVHPHYGILTGVNEQHLQTFGSLENTTKGKFELIESLPENGFGVINGDNALIAEAFPNYSKQLVLYGFSRNNFSIKELKQHPHGTTFDLLLDGNEYQASTKLLGRPNLQNILAAATMSFLLGMKSHAIVEAIATLKSVPHRLEIKTKDTITIIDDAYNSNVDGFKEAITLLNSFKQPKVLITPGIVDLGERTKEIHSQLGELLDEIDHVVLVGHSDRTIGLKEGIKNKDKIIQTETFNKAWDKIKELKLDNPVVLLENDLPDNY